MPQNMLLFFTNISAKNFVYILDYSFCAEHHILSHFYKMILPLKALNIFCAKAVLLCRQKCWSFSAARGHLPAIFVTK